MSLLPLEGAADANVFGGKAVSLGAALRAGLPVPNGFAVSVDELASLVVGNVTLRNELFARVEGFGGEPLAARSSAVGEDGADASFAGQHATALNLTTPEAVLEGLVLVHRSAHTEAALAYRRKKGITSPVRIAAVVQRLVDPVCAGVLFTRNPVTHVREYVIEAAWGLGEAVVAGLVTPDHYRLASDGRLLEVRVGDKDLAVRRLPDGGTEETPVSPDLAAARCLDDAGAIALSVLARRAEAVFGPDLDLEWAITAEALYLLQARPISTVPT